MEKFILKKKNGTFLKEKSHFWGTLPVVDEL